jgi:hypothetical protein
MGTLLFRLASFIVLAHQITDVLRKRYGSRKSHPTRFKFFVADTWCTHQRSDLSLGILEGMRVRCALHQALEEEEGEAKRRKGKRGGEEVHS